MNTIEIIDLKQLKSIKQLELRNTYITSLEFFLKLHLHKNLPLTNRNNVYKRVLSFLSWCDSRMNFYDTNTIQISKEIFEGFFTRNKYNKYIKLLTNLGLFKRVQYEDLTWYNQGEKSIQYEFSEEYLNDSLCIVLLDELKYKKIECSTKVDKRYSETIKNVELDYYEAITDEVNHCGNDTNKLRRRLSILLSIRNRRYINKGEKSNRIYHSLSNLSKVSRKHITIDGKGFKSIDIVNCQPLLLCYYLKKNNLSIDDNYIKDCEYGCFYERFVGGIIKETIYSKKMYSMITLFKNLDRDEVKIQLYKSIFFKFNVKNDINIKFSELYPETYKTLSTITNLASELQNIEAEIFNTLNPTSKHYFTLFDAIYFTDDKDIYVIDEEIHSKFIILGLNITTKIEY